MSVPGTLTSWYDGRDLVPVVEVELDSVGVGATGEVAFLFCPLFVGVFSVASTVVDLLLFLPKIK